MLVKRSEAHFRERLLCPAACVAHFASNDYLSLSLDSRVSAAFQQGFAQYPAGSGGSMLIGGYHPVHRTLEEAFCEALSSDDAVLFGSAYVANLALMALLADANITALIDKGIHASFYDGLKLSRTAYVRYPHQAYDMLEKKIKQLKTPVALVLESLYSMSGHFTPLNTLTNLAPLIVDEAHAFGLYGHEGLGSMMHFGLTQKEVPLRVISFGKAFNAQGAVVVGQKEWISALIQVARGYIYSTGMSPAYAYGLIEVFKIVRQAEEARKKLFDNVSYFRKLLQNATLNWKTSSTPIQHLILGSSHRALATAEKLIKQGLFCRAIRPPTVPQKEAGIRVVLNAAHTFHQLEQLVESLEKVDKG